MIHTACPYCGVGCGVVARPDGAISADIAHPANRGRLCSKGAALARTLDNSGRLTHPIVGGKPASWDDALSLISLKFQRTIDKHGPDSVAFYVSGQCLTEDYYVANKLMKGFIGSGNIDTNSRLCMASSVAGHNRAFGEDVVPGVYEDWEEADLVVLVGSNAAWCHPVLHQRLLAAKAARGTKIVVLDPRRTATAEAADLHLPLASGSDVSLFNGLLAFLKGAGRIDAAWVARHANGLDAALDAAGPDNIEETAALCGLDPELVEIFYELFARTERVMTVYSQGVNQSSVGTDKVNAIINCHLATGRIGRPGMGPFSVTGQPNAMRGREVGGLANQLAAHMKFDDPADRDALTRFWNAPSLTPKPGLKAVELFDAVAAGKVKALWIVATNPADSLPRTDRVRAALTKCPFVVVSDCWPTDTTALADVVLPASAWGEKDGTVTNSERRISRQRPFRPAPGEARPDWWMFAEVGRRMGWGDAFGWETPAAVFREHAALSGFENNGRRVFDIGGLADLDDAGFDALQPIRWPVPAGATGEAERLFGRGGFPTADGKARFIATPFLGLPDRGAHAFLLNTGRIRDQWHTMTRTGLAPSLMAHSPEPLLTLNPADAAAIGIEPNGLVRLSTDEGEVVLRADVRHSQRRGEIFAPMHWTDLFASTGPVGRTVGARVDPVSGQPELKATPASLTPVESHFHGLLLRRFGAALPDVCHWVRVPVDTGQLYRLTGLRAMPAGDDLAWFAQLLLAAPAGSEWIEVSDVARGVSRVAVIVDGVLDACLFLSRLPARLPREEAVTQMLGTAVPDPVRARLLAGRPQDAMVSEGPRVCACFGVSRDAVRHAAVTHRLRNVSEVGVLLRAGTNCGSCIPELEEILRDVRMPAS
jgi:assimilatory nitrate reductase catalytic subunit